MPEIADARGIESASLTLCLSPLVPLLSPAHLPHIKRHGGGRYAIMAKATRRPDGPIVGGERVTTITPVRR